MMTVMVRLKDNPTVNQVIHGVDRIIQNLHIITLQGAHGTRNFNEDDVLAIMIPLSLG